MDPMTALWYTGGTLFLLVLLQLFARPIGVILKLLGNSMLGAFAIWVINQMGVHLGFHLGLNPASALVAGLLGAPGVVGLGVIGWMLG